MNKQEFKETEIGRIPIEWEVKKIVDLFKIITGTTPSTKQKGYWSNGHINWITPGDMSKFNEELFIENSERKITERGLRETNLTLMPNESIIISTRAPVGYVVIVNGEATFNQGCKGLIPNRPKEINSIFYAYYLLNKKTLLQHSSSGSTFKELSKKTLEDFNIIFIPLPEQNKIAEILSSVDNTIKEVDESIAKTEKLKKALMQELLTKGIGHTEFKETEIGEIPEEWEVVKLGGESIAKVRGNRTINRFDIVAFIPMEYISESNLFVRYEMRFREEVKSFTYCECGDLLLAKITPSLENGKQGIVPDVLPNGFALATTEVFPILCKGIEKLFLYYLLKFSRFRNKIIFSMIGTTGRQRASKKSVENLFIPLPPLREQNKIAEILSTVDERIQLLKNKRNKLERVKKGLMNDLLIGRRRVKVEA
ncbi:MAG: restriction endonuclease subunit S [Actinomycetota bacterium]|nr:restriction endonuclease subunit S [Actinomycetota bacterium]